MILACSFGYSDVLNISSLKLTVRLTNGEFESLTLPCRDDVRRQETRGMTADDWPAFQEFNIKDAHAQVQDRVHRSTPIMD